MIRKGTLLGIAALLAATASSAWADPLAGEQLKFYQSPLDGIPTAPSPGIYPIGAVPSPGDAPAPFPGQDVLSTATVLPSGVVGGQVAADDFSDSNPNPIGHITWWGSYLNANAATNVVVPQFQVSLYTNGIGQNSAGPFSEPSQLIATQTLTLTTAPLISSSGTFTQSPAIADPGSPDGPLYEYNGELDWQKIPFPDAVFPNVEWLSIVALAPNIPGSTLPEFQWGWHDRDWGIFDPYAVPGDTRAGQPGYHFMDDAVTAAYPGAPGTYAPQFYSPNIDGQAGSMDLAFALYTPPIPEPISLPLLAGGMFLLRRHRKA